MCTKVEAQDLKCSQEGRGSAGVAEDDLCRLFLGARVLLAHTFPFPVIEERGTDAPPLPRRLSPPNSPRRLLGALPETCFAGSVHTPVTGSQQGAPELILGSRRALICCRGQRSDEGVIRLTAGVNLNQLLRARSQHFYRAALCAVGVGVE